MMLASDILTRVRVQLSDTGATQRWSDAELLNWITDAQRVIVAAVPAANAQDVVLQLAAGTKQPIATNIQMILHVTRNCAADGTPGRAIRRASRAQLDQFDPDWHTATATAAVSNYTYDPNDNVFYVYPPSDGSGHVLAVCAQIPVTVTATSQQLELRDSYTPAIAAFVMAQAHLKDADYAAGQQLASSYMAMFQQLLATLADQLLKNNPNAQAPPSGSA